LLSYFAVFQKRTLTMAEFRSLALAMARDDDAIIASLDAANIVKALVTGFDEATSARSTFVSNESVAAIAERHPTRFVPFCGADVLRGMPALREVDYWIGKRGFRGLSLRPFMIGRPASDRAYWPFYAKCIELDVPCSMHASANWTRNRPSDLAHPRHFDEVACAFPELKLILSHGGYPWVLEACLVAWKHPNVYLELAAHRPKYLATAGTGWEALLRFGSTTIQDKILYGTGAFLIGRPPAELVSELSALPLPPAIRHKWLYANAAKLLGIANE
jgi:predicted TIM-barrel fold metal-dependent hydrolase